MQIKVLFVFGMRPGQTRAQSASRIVGALEPVVAEEKPDIVLVQGGIQRQGSCS